MTRPHIQAVSDVRHIVMALVKIWDGDPHLAPDIRAMREIQRLSEEVIARGPHEFRFVLEQTASVPKIEQALRQSVFG